MARAPSCLCGECRKCKHREYMRGWYQRKSLEERRAWVARRDPEKARANRRADYHRHQEERRVAQRAYRATEGGKAAVRAASATWAERNPEKRKAQWAVNNAVRDGKLSKAPCEVCGEEEVDGHHDDYSKPLEVRWLCRVHHQAAHA